MGLSARAQKVPSCARLCGRDVHRNFFPIIPLTYSTYTKRKVVGVGIEVRSHGYAVRARNRYRKSWLLKNVIFTLATESLKFHPRLCTPIDID